ncbi:MAG: endonuclease domain-containing protein [Candidatus Shapirobacteria bacterium]|jgi:very-short-patch-repair endonuclease
MKKVVIEALNPLHGSINYLKELRGLSRKNRNNPTEAEEKIWRELLRNKKTGFTFLRQKPINRFVIDFYCSELNLAIEIDGNSHDKKIGYDQSRDKFLKQIGINTIRFTNDQILFRINQVKNILNLSLVKGRSGKAERD